MSGRPGGEAPLRCVLVGEHTLLVQCATTLLERGHLVLGIASPRSRLRQWAAEHGLPAADVGPELAGWLAGLSYDYLFSVANLRMLPPEVLATPRRLPINFHDAPLPRHAGVHATSWAILDGDTRHGVTWHVMTERPDAGPVLARRAVAVAAGDTAYTLNVKCYQAAADSFAELVDDLAGGSPTAVPQDLTGRTYHPRSAGPPRGGLVSWRAPAEALDAAVRACDFGPKRNAFGSVKLAAAGGLVLVRGARLERADSTEPPGTVMAVADDAVTVATTTRDIRLTLSTMAGDPIGPRELAARWGIRIAHRLAEPAPERIAAVAKAYRSVAGHEEFWAERLARLAPLRPPNTAEGGAADRQRYDFPAPGAASETVLGVLLAYLAMVGGAEGPEPGDVGVRWLPGSEPERDLLARYLPLPVPAPEERDDLIGYVGRVAREAAAVRARGPYARDAWARYPDLPKSLDGGWPVAIDIDDAPVPNQAGDPAPADADRDADGTGPRTALFVRIADGGCRWSVAADVPASLRDGFAAFLRAALAGSARLARLPLLGDVDRRRVLAEWNDTAAAYPRESCVPAVVDRWVRRRPTDPAVVAEGCTLTYAELGRRSDRLAGLLRRRGVGPGALVGVYLGRSADLVVALLGVMKAGAAYVPLDPVYPAERLAVMITDARLALLLTEERLVPTLPGGVLNVLPMERARSALESAGGGAQCDRADPDGLAYVIYTSGSTGVPKGVRVGHRALTNLLCAMARTPGFTDRDRLLAVTTVCFDIAALELFLPLVTGGCVQIAPAGAAADGFALRDLIERSRPTVLQATPATWRMLVAAGWDGDPGLRAWCGGEALAPDLADELTARAAAVWNLYGPTETTIWSAVAAVAPGGPVCIGRPIANTRCYVLDRWMRPVPPGVPGELYIGGDGVASGYLDRPELTRQRFVPSPFVEGDTLYRTGDRVRHRADGRLDYLGRVDDQLKVRGFRIEPGEVEAALRRHPAVRLAAVVAREDTPGDRRLVAYYVPQAAAPPAAQVRGFLAGTLPGYLVPAAVIAVDAIPLTPNGKVDRAALRRPGGPAGTAPAGTGLAGTAPAGTTAPLDPAPSGAAPVGIARAITAVWREVLRVERVGPDDRFFDLGGNSLLLVDVVARLRRELGGTLTGLDMFRYPTVRALAGHLERAGPAGGERPASRPRDTAALGALRHRRGAGTPPTPGTPGGDR